MDHPTVFRLVAGLGNPGREYANTRHNIGFLVVDELVRRMATTLRFEPKWNAQIAACGGRTLMKPQTFMNLSGESVADFARFYKLLPDETLIILDDVALPLGCLRLRKIGSAGGHNGLESVLVHLSTSAIPRLRVGIGSPNGTLHDHVLGGFESAELPILQETITRAADAVEYANAHGFEAAMNQFNQKPKNE